MKYTEIASHTGTNVYVVFNNGEAALGRLTMTADGKKFRVGRFGVEFTPRVVSVLYGQVKVEAPADKPKPTVTRKPAARKTTTRKPAAKKTTTRKAAATKPATKAETVVSGSGHRKPVKKRTARR